MILQTGPAEGLLPALQQLRPCRRRNGARVGFYATGLLPPTLLKKALIEPSVQSYHCSDLVTKTPPARSVKSMWRGLQRSELLLTEVRVVACFYFCISVPAQNPFPQLLAPGTLSVSFAPSN